MRARYELEMGVKPDTSKIYNQYRRVKRRTDLGERLMEGDYTVPAWYRMPKCAEYEGYGRGMIATVYVSIKDNQTGSVRRVPVRGVPIEQGMTASEIFDIAHGMLKQGDNRISYVEYGIRGNTKRYEILDDKSTIGEVCRTY